MSTKYISLIVWLLPASKMKNRFLNWLGNDIAKTAVLGPNIVLGCGNFQIEDDGAVWGFNVFRNLRTIRIGKKAVIGRLNYFTAAPEYQAFHPEAGSLIMKEMTFITNRHYFSCSGRVILEPFSAVGGVHSLLQTHELDIVRNVTTVGTIRIGERAIATASCVLLKGAFLPPRSILAAGSLMTRADNDTDAESGLWAGRPARKVRDLPDCAWWHRDSYLTPVTPFDEI